MLPLAFQSPSQKKVPEPFSPPNLYLRLGIAGVLGLILVGGIFFSAGRLKVLVAEIEKKRGQMVALQQKEENLRLLSVVLDSVKKETPLIEGALPDERGVVDFIKTVEDLGKEVNIESFSFESDRPQFDREGNSYIEWTIETSAPLAQLETFLEKLLALPLLIKPKLIDIDKIDEELGKLIFRGWLYVNPNFLSR